MWCKQLMYSNGGNLKCDAHSTILYTDTSYNQKQQAIYTDKYIRCSMKKIRHWFGRVWWHPVVSEWNGANDKFIVFFFRSSWWNGFLYDVLLGFFFYYAIIFIHKKALMCKPVCPYSGSSTSITGTALDAHIPYLLDIVSILYEKCSKRRKTTNKEKMVFK